MSTTIRLISDSQQLGEFLEQQAALRGWKVGFDTHYDAQNWQLSWWRGHILHRLDFQPLPGNIVTVTHYTDSFKILPRFLCWAHNVIPLLPYLAHIEFKPLGNLQFPFEDSDIKPIIEGRSF